MEHALRKYRRKKRLTLQGLAALAETSTATLSQIERGERNPSLSLIRRLIKATEGKIKADDFIPEEE